MLYVTVNLLELLTLYGSTSDNRADALKKLTATNILQ